MANFSEAQLQVLKETFEKHDADKSGAIDRTEIKAVLEALGITSSDTEVQELFGQVDSDKSGSIEWNEFLILMQKLGWSG